ncbi:MAG: hypothetical protein WBM64_08250 [Woeseiaceae bacterium]
MSTAFADKKGMPNPNSVADITNWEVDCGGPEFSVISDTKELSNILLVFNDGTWEKFEIEDGNLTFTYTYEPPERRVVTAFVKAGSVKTEKDDRYGGKKLGFEFDCTDTTPPPPLN